MDIFDLVATLSLDSSKYEEGLQGAESNASSVGSKILGGLGKVGAGVGAVVGAVGAGVTAVSGALVGGTKDLAEYADNVDKMSQKMGISAEAYQEWDAVMQHSGTSMETLKASMKTMANAVENNNEAFQQLGLTEEQLAEMSQEDIFSAVITGLQNMEEGTERTYIAGQLLGRGATELGALLNTSAEETQAMKDRVHELGGVLSDEAVKAGASFQDQLQDMQTAQQSLSRNMLSDFLPSITTVMGGLTDIFAGDTDLGLEKISAGVDDVISKVTDKLPEFMEIGSHIVLSLAESILTNAPKIVSTGVSVIEDLILKIGGMLPEIVNMASSLIVEIVNSLSAAAPVLIPAVIEAVMNTIDALISNLPLILSSLLDFVKILVTSILEDGLPLLISRLPDIIMGVIDFILSAIPQIIQAVISIVKAIAENLPLIIQQIVDVLPDLITSVIDAILSNLPLFIECGIELFLALVEALPQIIVAIVEAIPQIIEAIVVAIVKAFPKIVEVGKQLLTSLAEGLGKLGNIIGNTVSKIWNAIKNALTEKIAKIKEIGANILQGLVDGIKSKITAVTDTIKNVSGKISDGFKDFFGIASPSKLFKEYGKFLDEGFAIGVEDNADTVDKAMDKTFDFSEPIVGVTNQTNNGTMGADRDTNRIIELLEMLVDKDPVEIGANSDGIFNLVRKKSAEYHKSNNRSAFA